ncbi:glycoside hydrolase family 44 protein [Paenibacillus sp. YYML68]|uniref:glycoside hydrolase family 44 protein n=1 Tax=Paenibacillus sp. YYML68 TaxID=2909250 RepID=UPI002490FB52|nr:glycoside hydrolase family 44 protein [Paenibacillus sp. YYML68]
MLLVLALAMSSVGLSVLTQQASAAEAVQTAVTIASELEAGAAAPVQVHLTADKSLNVLVDVEIFDASFKKVHQMFTDNVNLPAGQSVSVPFTWNVPAQLAPGSYIVSIGVFGAGWSGMHKWHAGAGSFTVKKGSQQPAIHFTGAIQAAPASVTVGGTVALQATVTAAAYADAVIELSLLDPAGVKVHSVSTPKSFADGETASFPTSWTVPQQAQPGTYRAELTVWKPGQSTRYESGSASAPVQVKSAEQPGGGQLSVSLETSANVQTQMPSVAFKLHNEGKTAVSLHEVMARYYFTIDQESALKLDFWSTVAKANVKTRFVKMPIPSADADHYMELTFTKEAGTLAPGAAVTVSTWFNKTNWSSFNQTNDYSYIKASSYTKATKAPAYVAGKLVWGTEPTLLDMPAFPSNIQATPTETTVQLTWDAVEGADGYEVYADGSLFRVTEPMYLDQWLRTGTLHTYKVRAVKGDTYSVWSGLLQVKTLGEQMLPAPRGVRAERTDSSIAITWKALEETITGYDIEVDGAVVRLGKVTAYTHSGLTPGSQHTYRVRAVDGQTLGPWSELVRANTVYEPNGTFTVQMSIDPSAERAPISPYIYGTNDELTGEENWTARRMGGNRLSTYNWENNASNAGKDYFWRSDGYIPWFYGNIMDRSLYDVPGIGATAFHERSLSKGSYTLLTLQTAGYVAASRSDTSVTEEAPSPQWVEVKASKNAPFTLTPDLHDGKVYMDEFVNFIVNKFGPASSATGVKGFEIDNEPALWGENHKYMHPEQTRGVEVLNKSIELAKAVKKVDPTVEMFGPVSYGFSEYLIMDNKAEWETIKGSYDWYLDYYLDKLRVASEQEGRRLLDVLDLHWYPEATDGSVTISNPYVENTLATHKARVQAPRTLWDASYTENSWIGQFYSRFLPLIPRLQQSINEYNPGTKLAFTEYNYGGENHISGGIAMADVLGIFGKYGVYMANYWKMTSPENTAYSSAATKIYTNYDGNGSSYGDTKVKAETSDPENSSVYSSVYTDNDNKLHMIVMNKNFDYDMSAVIEISGDASYKSARVFAYDGDSPVITEREGVAHIEGNTFTLNVPKTTVAHIVLSKE